MTDRELSLLANAARFDGAEGISSGLQAIALILDRLVDAVAGTTNCEILSDVDG